MITRTRRLPLLVLAALAAGPVGAQTTSPYSAYLSQGFTGNWNVLNESKGKNIRKDIISSTGLGATFDQPFGRQRLVANGDIVRNTYKSNSYLNDTEYKLGARADLETAGDITGSARASASRRAEHEGDNQLWRLGDRVLGLRAQMGLNALIGIEAGLARRAVRYDPADAATAATHPLDFKTDFNETVKQVGLRFRPSQIWTLGLGLRSSDGERERYVYDTNLLAFFKNWNDFKRSDIDLTTAWKPSELTEMRARLSRTTFEESWGDKRSLNTGAISLIWRPSALLELTGGFRRDTDVGFSDFDRDPTPLTALQSELGTSFNLGARWEVSAFVVGTAGLAIERHEYFDSSDSTRRFTLGAIYVPRRWLEFNAAVTQESRSGAVSPSEKKEITNDFSTTTATVGATLRLN